jgi:L-ribulokinase
MPALITGTTNPATLKRGRCSAGHKAMWHEDWNGLPPEEFLVKLDPVLKGLRERLFNDTYTIDEKVGNLTPEWAKRLGLSEKVVVGISAFDCHLGAIGADIKPYYLSKVMGTSTCDILIAPLDEIKGKLVKGICGQVDGSVVPGMMGLEAGQSAFGDVYAWFKQLLLWPVNNLLAGSSLLDEATKAKLIDEISGKIIPELEKQAALIPIAESGVIALDWMNGRRTPDANQLLTGAITGINLGTDAPRVFRALVEATAFGAKRIADRFIEEGVDIKGVIALGGVAKKSKFVMQTVADIFNMPILVARSEQACALGSAMAAAKVAGLYPTVLDAQKAMSGGFETEYYPIAENVAKYKALYEEYITVGNFVESQVKR